jgi:hypothetical protein
MVASFNTAETFSNSLNASCKLTSDRTHGDISRNGCARKLNVLQFLVELLDERIWFDRLYIDGGVDGFCLGNICAVLAASLQRSNIAGDMCA